MKQFETFGEYMFDLLFAPLKKGRKTVNQLRIFWRPIEVNVFILLRLLSHW